VLLALGVISTPLGIYNEVSACRRGGRPDPTLTLGLAVGPFLCLLAGNRAVVEAISGQRSSILDVATGVAAIAGGVLLLYRLIRR
jgi:hypothetical protein